MRIGPNIRKRADGRFEARYIKSRTDEGKIVYGFCYGKTYDEAKKKRTEIIGINKPDSFTAKHMNLLILGAGDHGHTVYETAQAIRLFEKIRYLDDIKLGEIIIGKCDDYKAFLCDYPIAIPAFGDNDTRKKWFGLLQSAGFIIPTIVHPTALISPSTLIEQGTIVEARATVNSGVSIGTACIISTNVTIDSSANIGDYTYTSPGITIPKRSQINPCSNVLA